MKYASSQIGSTFNDWSMCTVCQQQVIPQGREGRGTIYVWASGNGGLLFDNCNLDGYASSIYTLTVSALTDLGESTFYCEPCASTLAGVYVGGQHALNEALVQNQFENKVVSVFCVSITLWCVAT